MIKTAEYNLRGMGQAARGKRTPRAWSFHAPRPSPLAPGFSLTEVLIVIALIVLILAMALPAFNFITGGRSVDSATNQISAMLSRARTEALGLQEIRGVMFYIDPASQREMMALVAQTPAETGDNAAVDVYLDAEPNDHIPLPKGIGIEVTNDSSVSGTDNYLGFNTYTDPGTTGPTIKIGGIILFDGYGRLANKHYGFRMQFPGSPNPSAMSALIFPNLTALANDFTPNPPAIPLLSSFGFVLFEDDLMKDKFGDYLSDPLFGGANDSGEESWLDDNATAVLINRYNGTLVRGN